MTDNRETGNPTNLSEGPSHSNGAYGVEKRFKLAAKAADLGVFEWQVNKDKIIYENARMGEIFGQWPKSGSISKNLFIKHLHPDDVKVFEKAFSQTLTSGGDFSAICRVVQKENKGNRLVKFTGELEKDENKEPSRIIGIVQDITDHKKYSPSAAKTPADVVLRYGARQLRTLTDALPVLISYVDNNCYYRYANRTYTEWFGSENEQIVGFHMRDVLGEEAYQAILPNVKTVLTGKSVFYEQMIPYKKVGPRYVLVNYVPDVHIDGIKGFYVLVQDITNRKRHEANQAFLAELSEELSQLSHANDIIQAVGKKLGDFLHISACLFADLKEEKDECYVEYAWYNEKGISGMKGFHRLSEFTSNEFLHSARSGETIVICDTQTDTRVNAGNYAALNIRSSISVPCLRNGKWKYLITFVSPDIRAWRKDEIELLEEKANRLCLRIERARAEEAIRNSEAKLAAELADTKQLQLISTQLIQQNNINKLYEQILDASMAIMDSQMASLQMLDQNSNELELLAWRGFHLDSAKFWQHVNLNSNSTCGESLRTTKRVIVSDIDHQDLLTSSEDYHYFKISGIKAVQTTPLISRSGHLVGTISTHWKKAHKPKERELRMLDVLARQAADLIETKISEEALKDADRRKDEFLATLSHELRNPLTPIKTALELMEDETDEELKDQALGIMVRQVDRMAHLLNDLMDISRITRGKIQLKKDRIALSKALEAAKETIEPSLAKKNHTFLLTPPDEPIYINADMDRIVQIITNLLTNAIKYTKPGGKISLTAHQQNDNAIIKVKDNGIGISKNHLEAIFKMFNQVERRESGTQSGLGIGLSLSKNLVEMHGGTIRANSNGKGKGSEFVVSLPVLKSNTQKKSGTPTKHTYKTTNSSKRILVVDDNVDIADTLQTGLMLVGHKTKVYYNGKDALENFADFQPEVAILDIGLPDIEGYEVARELRKYSDDILLIALTGWGQKKDRMKSKSAGFDFHLVKPAGIKDILDIVNKKKT